MNTDKHRCKNPPIPPLKKGGEGGFEIFVSKKEIKPVLNRLSQALMRLGYDDDDGGRLRNRIIREFERIFGRAGLFQKDVNMFFGLCARIDERACHPCQSRQSGDMEKAG